MRFAFTDDQLLFQEAARAFLDKECPPEAVRRVWEGDAGEGESRRRWNGLADLGVLGLLLPEEHGGSAGTDLDLVLVLEETGRAALPEPVIDTAAVGGPLLAELGDGEVRGDWLPRIVAGEAMLGVQKGGKAYINGADRTDALVLVRDDEVHLVPTAEVSLTPETSVDGARRLFIVDWHRSSATLLDQGERAWSAVNRAFDRGALATAAQLVGIADRMLEMTVAYAKEREQFGAPIGSFQAVKHQLADALLRLDFARPVVHRAAHSVANDLPDRSRDVSMAKVYAAEAAHLAGRTALQCHGAIGYTVEYDLHLFMKRAWALESEWGETRWHRERVATAVLGPHDQRGTRS